MNRVNEEVTMKRLFQFEDCYAELIDGSLKVGNSKIERSWKIVDGRLHSLSLVDAVASFEWLRKSESSPPVASVPPGVDSDVRMNYQVDFSSIPRNAVESAALRVLIDASYEGGQILTEIVLFPETAACSIACRVTGISADPTSAETSIEGEDISDCEAAAIHPSLELPTEDLVDALDLVPLHLRFLEIEFSDATDRSNTLVHRREWLLHRSDSILQRFGNLFVFEDIVTGQGFIFLKEAPLPHARTVVAPSDCWLDSGGRRLRFRGHGIDLQNGQGYRHALLCYSGGAAGRSEALHAYQRKVRPHVSNRDGLFLSNTWGDRSSDSRMNEAFILKELEAGHRLGVEICQLDDGWQKGRSINSAQAGGVWNGFWAADEDFWKPHPQRFPNGLEPIVQRARELDMRLGLWYAPDSSGEFLNWQRDAACVLDLHRDYSINHFKIDSIKALTRTSESNLYRFVGTVLEESKGNVTFDLDITSGVRPGYFGLLNCGPLFIENRYTDGNSYWPHHTLRNLWMLSHYVDPIRLRFEFLNNQRMQEMYVNDPFAPAEYSSDYLFATIMMGSPLGWFECSHLSDNYIDTAAPLVRTWKTHRAALRSSRIMPIGEMPTGTSWTGFVAEGADADYLLLFRETNEREEFFITLPSCNGRCVILHGEGELRRQANHLVAHLPQARSVLFARFAK